MLRFPSVGGWCGGIRRWLPLASAGVLIGAAALPAQSATQRRQIEAFRDSIGAVGDSFPLLTEEKILIAHASHELRDSAMVHLRLGFVAMRLGDLGGQGHYQDAASEFQWATDLQPMWPYGWFGLGLAELGVGDASVAVLRDLQTALGKDALTRSASDFARSAEVDPGFARGLVELSNTALRQRVNLRMDVALAALRRAAATAAARDPEVELARARIEREVGSPDSALAAVDSLVAHHPDNAAALLEQARVRFKLGRRDGSVPWYAGLATSDTTAIGLYRADLRFILPDSTLRAFDAASGAARVALMRRFWEVRDRDELHAPGGRLMEHYRRLDVARHNYRLASTHRHYDIIERYRPPELDFDDRGVIYIRQGEPDARATLDQPGLPYNESWAYYRHGAPDLLFHFVAQEGVTDFRLVASVLDIVGYANAVRLQNSGDIQGNDAPLLPLRGAITADSARWLSQRQSDAALSQTTAAIMRSRVALNPIYQRMLTSGRAGAGGLWTEERAIGTRSIHIGTTTDSWERHFATDLPARVQVLAVSLDTAHPVLQIAWAIPVDSVPGVARGALPTLRASVLGPGGGIVGWVDSVGAGAVTPVAVGRELLGAIAVPVPPGRFTVRVGLEVGGAGVVSNRDTVHVPAPTGPEPGLSDLVLGATTVPLWWTTTAGDTVRVNPAGDFRLADPMTLYFEVDGLMPDSTYRIEQVVRRPGKNGPFHWLARLFGGGGNGANTITTTERAAGPRLLVHREVDLHNLKPGPYVLEVSISRRSGPEVTRTREFTVRQ